MYQNDGCYQCPEFHKCEIFWDNLENEIKEELKGKWEKTT